MTPALGMYYRLRAELRKRRVAGDRVSAQKRRHSRETTDVTMFLRLLAVTGGLLLAISLIMQSIQ